MQFANQSLASYTTNPPLRGLNVRETVELNVAKQQLDNEQMVRGPNGRETVSALCIYTGNVRLGEQLLENMRSSDLFRTIYAKQIGELTVFLQNARQMQEAPS